jgi:hypothetical protein
MAEERDYRPVGFVLMAGLVALPLLFGWWLLRPGYAPSLRWVVLVYALWPTVAAITVILLALVVTWVAQFIPNI